MSRLEDRRAMMPRPPDITITLPLEAVNLMLQVLGKAPYEQVADLVMAVRSQAQQQIATQQPEPAALPDPLALKRNGGEPKAPDA